MSQSPVPFAPETLETLHRAVRLATDLRHDTVGLEHLLLAIADASAKITGGVAEALIATMCGLAIAIMGLLPFNYLNARSEEARHDIEDASNSLEIIIKKSETNSAR